ncbi:hypothetical protein VTO73DRAFT_4766 [Trametes versicolor]
MDSTTLSHLSGITDILGFSHSLPPHCMTYLVGLRRLGPAPGRPRNTPDSSVILDTPMLALFDATRESAAVSFSLSVSSLSSLSFLSCYALLLSSVC